MMKFATLSQRRMTALGGNLPGPRRGREGLESAQPFRSDASWRRTGFHAVQPFAGPSRSSTALNPEPTAQTDPRTRSRGITRVAVGAFSAMVVVVGKR
jgi:hypothetical protein